MSEASTRKLTVRCPDCQAELVVDAATGTVLSHRKPKTPLAGGQTFETLFAELDASKARAEDLFEREKAAMADKDRILEEKFREAMKRAEEDPDTPPKRPFDLD
jgi:hypothetical protein